MKMLHKVLSTAAIICGVVIAAHAVSSAQSVQQSTATEVSSENLSQMENQIETSVMSAEQLGLAPMKVQDWVRIGQWRNFDGNPVDVMANERSLNTDHQGNYNALLASVFRPAINFEGLDKPVALIQEGVTFNCQSHKMEIFIIQISAQDDSVVMKQELPEKWTDIHGVPRLLYNSVCNG